jgi:hypothetical protein
VDDGASSRKAQEALTPLRLKYRPGCHTMFLLSEGPREAGTSPPSSPCLPLASGYVVPVRERWRALRGFLEGTQSLRANGSHLTLMLVNRSAFPLALTAFHPDGPAWHQFPPLLPADSAAVLSIKNTRKVCFFCHPLPEHVPTVGRFVAIVSVQEPTVGSCRSGVEIRPDVDAVNLKAELDGPLKATIEYPNIATATFPLVAHNQPDPEGPRLSDGEAPPEPSDDDTPEALVSVCCRYWIHRKSAQHVPWFVFKLLQ